MRKTFTNADRDLSVEDLKIGMKIYQEMMEVAKMGVIADRVAKAFKMYKAGDIKGFVKEIIDTADYSVHSSTHRAALDKAIDIEFEKLKR